MKPAYLIALFILAGTMVVTLFVFSRTLANHVTIPEAMAAPGQPFQVPGNILKNTVSYDPTIHQLRFDIVDPKGSSRMTVLYDQPKPENFDTADKVEAVGQYAGGAFHATNLLIKCPSKYNDQQKPKGTALLSRRSAWKAAARSEMSPRNGNPNPMEMGA